MKTQKKKQLECPNCKSILDVDELLVSQFEDTIRKDLQAELKRRENELAKQREEYHKLSQNLESEKQNIDDLVSQRVKSQLKEREKNLKNSIIKEVEEEKSQQLEELEQELHKKSAQQIELNQTKAKLKRLSREFEEREAKIHLQKEEELANRLEKAKTSMKEELQMESFLKIKEKENIIASLTKKLEEAKQRATQGSMQMQGEAQELVIEDMLRELHPDDVIDEVKKVQEVQIAFKPFD